MAQQMEPAAFVPFKHLLKAPSRKAVEEMFATAFKARLVRPPPTALVDATASVLQVESSDARAVSVSMWPLCVSPGCCSTWWGEGKCSHTFLDDGEVFS